MSQEKDLRIYCFSVRNRSGFNNEILRSDRSHFYLGYSLDDVTDSVTKRFGTGLDIIMHGDISFKEMASKVEVMNFITDAPQFRSDIFKAGTMIPAAASKEMNQMQFVNGLRLVADRFVDAEDRKRLQEIIDKVNFKK